VDDIDQRGFLRFPPGDPVCDIGAFEANSFAGGPEPAEAQAPTLSPAALIALVLVLFTVGTGLLRRRRV
jgi:hypothetical protein